MNHMISKSKYCKAVQCPKILWLEMNKPEEADAEALNQAVLEAGNEVGDLAMGLFGEFTEVPFLTSKGEMVSMTRDLIEQDCTVI